jgi:hypothetical protein
VALVESGAPTPATGVNDGGSLAGNASKDASATASSGYAIGGQPCVSLRAFVSQA